MFYWSRLPPRRSRTALLTVEEHPNVGGLVAAVQYSDGTWTYCAGTLISETVFLTAAHCGDEGEAVRVTFDTDYQAGDDIHSGTFRADPLYTQSQNDPHDIAVVVFDRPVKKIAPALLPKLGALSQLSIEPEIHVRRLRRLHGDQRPGWKVAIYTRRSDESRRHAQRHQPRLAAHLDEPVDRETAERATATPADPNFLGSSTTIAATTITGDAVCRSTNAVYRLDTPSARSFLSGFVTLP